MEITWKFNPDEPEDASKLKRYEKADAMYSALYEFGEYLRRKLKYDNALSDTALEVFEQVRAEFLRILEEREVDLD
jgi:hypothetical protein